MRINHIALLHERRTGHPNTFLIVFEIGARRRLLKSSGNLDAVFGGDEELRKICRVNLSQRALRVSFIIWQRRDSKQWNGDPQTCLA